ncbi:hypothetical protein LINPERPRIM_LOCUS38423 [Linum perenne]
MFPRLSNSRRNELFFTISFSNFLDSGIEGNISTRQRCSRHSRYSSPSTFRKHLRLRSFRFWSCSSSDNNYGGNPTAQALASSLNWLGKGIALTNNSSQSGILKAEAFPHHHILIKLTTTSALQGLGFHELADMKVLTLSGWSNSRALAMPPRIDTSKLYYR